ncbi:hypothetical protein L228DRAFT_243336 [Xylona heveae TC161]|uniref:Sulfhydryl oxidase n=1 Tax=Xylona heveae (strain CBS 132557 / TC161) TaxID=1328760 RepID=A0A165JZ60_XYLHT|nr:hypothetical protein L228DRAFT_243336 [Xylona heveae TC161]KZF26813.1 hypothetical protein L228DRAFT_243336 [Xylona heveae TC161]
MIAGTSRRFILVLVTIVGFLTLSLVFKFQNQPQQLTRTGNVGKLTATDHVVEPSSLTGDAIMPFLGNETVKAELGRASWKLFHTIFARFPEKPTPDESAALEAYIRLFARLYPCGECARHFRKLLEQFPPQTSSRNSAAAWGCSVHNEVNKRLKKELFDCSNLGDFYDCGCGEDEEGEGKPADKSGTGNLEKSTDHKSDLKGTPEKEADLEYNKSATPLHLEKEGLTPGG